MKNRIAGINILLAVCFLYSCNVENDFIPPDFEEKLCINAVINNGRDLNKIIIEKTFQSEYPSDVNASLENLSIIIKSESKIVFESVRPKSQNRIDTVYLPADLELIPGEKYTLLVSEKNSESISSEIVVPQVPIISEIIIQGTSQTFLPPPLECHNPIKEIIFNVKFQSDEDSFYYLDIAGYLDPLYKDFPVSLIDYDIIESNSSYFKTGLYGFRGIGFSSCFSTPFLTIPGHTYEPCFFDGKTIPGNSCNIKIKIDKNSFYDYTKPIRITLNSIPKDLFSYEKSYHTYLETLLDPFSEPVYLNGNIKGGYGIFSICSGTQATLIIPADILISKP
jgi:hypothetical protein